MKGFAQGNPIPVAVYFVAVAGIAMFSMDPAVLSLSLLGAALTFLVLCGRGRLGEHLFAAGMFLAAALINPLTYHDGVTVLMVVNHRPVTLEALWYGLTAGGMIVAVLYWFRSFSRIMTSDKLLYLFGGLSPKLALVLSMALRYVSLYGAQARRVRQAQQAMGLYREDNLPDTLRGGARIFSVMAGWTLENGIVTADSMTARGYGVGRRSRYSLFRFTWQDGLLLAAVALLTGLTLYGLAGRTVQFYPAFAFPAVNARAMMGYAAYGVMMLIPAGMEGREAIRWHMRRR